MNVDFVTKEWIPALRSGEYQQTRHYLHDDHGYCCLGVACDLVMKKGVLPAWGKAVKQYQNEGDPCFGVRDENQVSGVNTRTIPPDGLEYIGLDSDEQRHLAMLNDEGASFATIASLLEDRVVAVGGRI